jgi:hypothetical protein
LAATQTPRCVMPSVRERATNAAQHCRGIGIQAGDYVVTESGPDSRSAFLITAVGRTFILTVKTATFHHGRWFREPDQYEAITFVVRDGNMRRATAGELVSVNAV